MRNPFELTPDKNVLFPDSKQTDAEILGESFEKIGQSFDKVLDDAQKEAKLVETIFNNEM